ncbi:protein-L-isoaspartate O-methyltransferase [Actinoplanes sp. NPDC051494]|uniref:protein-L-isoaspartate O-methyltransferase n=1 Tax=Actinoplanes sp. NPDC051494 TaxID=3363907 RepID=UPI00378B17E6
MTELGRRLVGEIEHDGVTLTPALARAFATVPRETFVAGGFHRPDGTWAGPGSTGFLDAVYRDAVLVTKLDDGTPVSSSSQPALMAIMLEALGVRPGDRVLEIGTGTGYNAALLARLGATVTSIDVQDDVAAQARLALARAGATGVEVRAGDGYTGAPGHHFDRVIVTVGVSGVSPHWLSQTRAGPTGPVETGAVVVPVAHGGTHPVLAVRGSAGGPVTASVVCAAGFMSAAGPLAARHPASHPAPAVVAGLTEVAPARWTEPLDPAGYRDLWYAAGVWSTRATQAALPGRPQSTLALIDHDGTGGGAAIRPDGGIVAGGPHAGRLAAEAAMVLDRWESAGRPPMRAWHVTLELAGDHRDPIWVPAGWALAPR